MPDLAQSTFAADGVASKLSRSVSLRHSHLATSVACPSCSPCVQALQRSCPRAIAMTGANKKRQKASRKGGAGGPAKAHSSDDSPVDAGESIVESQPQTPPRKDVGRPFGYDGGNSPTGSSRQGGEPASTTAPPTSPTPSSNPASTTLRPITIPVNTFEGARLRTDINRLLDLPPAAFNLNGQVSSRSLRMALFSVLSLACIHLFPGATECGLPCYSLTCAACLM